MLSLYVYRNQIYSDFAEGKIKAQIFCDLFEIIQGANIVWRQYAKACSRTT